MTPICIPLHPSGGKFRDNTELRLTLRSLEAHLQFPFEVVIIGEALPGWARGLRLLPCKGGLKSALVAAAEAFPGGFFWHYDDCVALRDTSVAEMKVTAACKGWRKNHNTGWSRRLDEIRQRLEAEGHPAFDYSRPHGTYWFDKGMIDEAFADWPGMAGKFPFESWILSKRDWPRRFGIVKQYYGDFHGEPPAHSWFLNWSDRGLTDGLLGYLRARFARPSRYEGDHPVAWPAVVSRKVDVHTIRFGDTWWLRFCAPTLDAWAARHGHRLKVWGADDIDPAYPAAKFCEVDMLREFLAGDGELLLYVDADVYVDEHAPPHPDPSADLLMREDLPGAGPRDFRRWCRRHGKTAHGWTPRNAGVWMATREGARRLLEVIEPPYIAGCQEQHQFNWWLHQAAIAGLEVGFLPAAWNSWAYHPERGAFYHLAGKKKAKRVAMFRANGLIPRDAVAAGNFRRAFDDAPFEFTRHGNGWDADDLHIHALHVLAGIDTGRPGPERVAVEVGAFRGRSTAALVDALHKGLIGHLHIVEIRPNDSLRNVIALAPVGKVTLHTKPFWDTDIGPVDLVFIDGDHRWPAVGDTLRALTWGARIIACHDTQGWPRLSGLWGAHLAGRMLKDMPGRAWVEDAEDRPGQRTFRGFLVSAEAGIDLDPLREFFQAAGAPLPEDDEAGEDDEEEDLAEPSPDPGHALAWVDD